MSILRSKFSYLIISTNIDLVPGVWATTLKKKIINQSSHFLLFVILWFNYLSIFYIKKEEKGKKNLCVKKGPKLFTMLKINYLYLGTYLYRVELWPLVWNRSSYFWKTVKKSIAPFQYYKCIYWKLSPTYSSKKLLCSQTFEPAHII